MEKQIVVFNIGEEIYGVNISMVQEIICPQEITAVPNSIDFVEGVISLRNEVVPIVDLGKRFNTFGNDQEKKFMIVSINEQKMGLIVDGVTEVLSLPENSIEAAPHITRNIDSKFIEGVGKWKESLIILINMEDIFSTEEISSIELTADNHETVNL